MCASTALVLSSLLLGAVANIDNSILKHILRHKSLASAVQFELNGANLVWPCENTREIYTSCGRYKSSSVIATRVQTVNEYGIVCLPRYRSGIPYTVARFALKDKNCFSQLYPFPCWPMHQEGDCHAIQNAVDLVHDQNNILWVLDIGIVNTLEQPIKRCSPKIVGINTKTTLVVQVIDLGDLITSESRLQYLAVEYASGNPFIYISDAGTHTILVYDVNNHKGFRVVLPKVVTVGSSRNDLLYISLIRELKHNLLYFTYLNSPRMFSIKTSLLRQGKSIGSVVDAGIKPNGQKIVFLGNDNSVNLFFRTKGTSKIYMWNTKTRFVPENWVLIQNNGDARLATQVTPGYKNLLWVIESNFQDYINNTVGCLGASALFHPLIKKSNL